MKILFVSYYYWPPYFGGELIISIERFESLGKRGHEITFLTSGVDRLARHELANGINIFRSPKIGDLRFARGIRRLIFPFWVVLNILKKNFDILHLSEIGGLGPILNTFGNWMICRFGKYRNLKIVYVHSLADTEQEMFSEEGIERRLRKFYLDQCEIIVSVSPALHTAVKKVYPDKARLIPSGVRNDLFVPMEALEKKERRKMLGYNPQDVIFSFLGTATYRKGFDILAKVFLENFEQHPDWHLWIIGPISKKENQNLDDEEVRKLISPLQTIKDQVKFWGRVNDRKQLSELMSISDIFVFPTRREGMPLAPLEAMAAGSPVIISKIPGITDLAIIDQVSGLFIEPGDANSLKTAMIKLAGAHELRARMGAAGVKCVNSDFSWQRHVRDWENLYQSLSGETRKK